MKLEVIIDANQFSDLAGFAEHFSHVALRDQYRWNGNLNAFNDILRGGFGTPEDGFTVVWQNHEKSRRDLAQTFDKFIGDYSNSQSKRPGIRRPGRSET